MRFLSTALSALLGAALGLLAVRLLLQPLLAYMEDDIGAQLVMFGPVVFMLIAGAVAGAVAAGRLAWRLHARCSGGATGTRPEPPSA